MKRVDRLAPLPDEMQGIWVAVEEPSTLLIVNGGEISCFGKVISYDYKEVDHISGALCVNLYVNDENLQDEFDQNNITNLVITPEGEFICYNVESNLQFVRQIK